MNGTSVFMSTNKEVVVVRATEALRSHLCQLGFDLLAKKTTAPPAFFLVDSPYVGVSADEPLSPHQKRAELMKGWFQHAFELELAELGLPRASWPETADVEVFQSFFFVEFHPLIGDLGALPLKSSMVQI